VEAVVEPLRAVHTVALRLGAAPRRREVELLAQRGRVRLEQPAQPVTEPGAPLVAASLGLTRREAEVLALVAAGRTNRQIGQALFITPKTASVHVSRILAQAGPAAVRRPRSPTDSASISNDPRRPWPLLLGVAADAAGQSATRSATSRWPRRPRHLLGSGYLLLAWPRRRQQAK
jgi:hypothetical protein